MLKIKNLYKVFNQGTINENLLFKGLNLDVDEGDFVTIIGSNGAGKSTLLNIIGGTLKADRGSIELDGVNISNLSEFKCSKEIGRVFQDPSKGVACSMTILENMSMAYNKGKAFGLSMGVSNKNINLFKELLSQLNLGLEEKLHVKVGLLSGGQRQALSLLMAVMSKPKLLLLDEHTAALDPKTSEDIVRITSDVIDHNKITAMMVTHNLNHAIKTGNRLVMMHQGEIVVNLSGQEKKDLNMEKLMGYFEKVKGNDLLSDRMLFL